MTRDIDAIAAMKRLRREKIAARPVADKLRLLDAMRERNTAIWASRPPAVTQLVEAIKNLPS